MSEIGAKKIEAMMMKAKIASAVFHESDQEHTDRIVRAVYKAAFDNRVRLAEMAIEETGLGKLEDKIMKNVLASQFVYEDIKDLQTVGIGPEDKKTGIIEIYQPLGPIFAIIPMTNPTSTTIFKIMIALKTRNPIIIHPHRVALECTTETARICYEAAMSEDAPEDCIQWGSGFDREDTNNMMAHKDLALVLATGGSSLVNAAYSSGTPAIGVGAGNVPVYIERSADYDYAVENIILSKTFDNGTVCASEQAIVVEKDYSDYIQKKFESSKCYFMNDDEIEKVNKVVFNSKKGIMEGGIVGKSAEYIAGLAGISVPEGTVLLIGKLQNVGADIPLSHEILAPVIAYYEVDDFDSAVNKCIDLNYHGGVGHTVSIYSNDDAKIKDFSLHMNAGRIVVNTPSSHGAVGGFYNALNASLTLGCGSGGKNITTDNVSAEHLLNIQRITKKKLNQKFFAFDQTKYFNPNYKSGSLEKEFNHNF
ncbi:MAG: aldehyde dehydrogenase family protein [Candidatus Kapaibacterium sp.]